MSIVPGGNAIPKDLQLQISGLVGEDRPFSRRQLLEELVSTFPKDPEVRLLVYTGQFTSEGVVPWHIHNGQLIVIMLQGESILQFADECFYYRAGDVIVEPVGVVHRAYNPNPDVPVSAMAIQLTPLDRGSHSQRRWAAHGRNANYCPARSRPSTATATHAPPRLVRRGRGHSAPSGSPVLRWPTD